jgi:hypothetical protein
MSTYQGDKEDIFSDAISKDGRHVNVIFASVLSLEPSSFLLPNNCLSSPRAPHALHLT